MRTPAVLPVVLMAAAIGAGCTTSRPAPVSERTPPARSATAPQPKPATAARPGASADTRSDTYVVKPGDTLYSIALEHGVDYRELAIWNGIDNPGAIRVGQQLRTTAPGTPAASASGVVAAPLKGPTGGVQGQPLGTGPAAAASPLPAKPAAGAAVSEPRGVRVPYTEQAYAELSKPPVVAVTPAPAQKTEVAKPDPKPETRADTDTARGPDDVDWAWPVKGKVISTFNDTTSKGIAISGKLGQPVLASAPGRVIFSGTGIRGFGKLIVIKHNNTYLSVYAHNNELTVKEGQNVTRGQKIAEMGSTDADQVKLHFEIRRFGKPTDPLKLLPNAG